MSRPSSVCARVLALALLLGGCSDPPAPPPRDAAADVDDLAQAADRGAPGDAPVPRDDLADVPLVQDALAADVPIEPPADAPNADGMDAASDAAPDAPVVEPDDAPPLDVDLDAGVIAECRTFRADVPPDRGPECVPGRTAACTCADGRAGASTCRPEARWTVCHCQPADAGANVLEGSILRITAARLLAPQSGSRATSQRPTFRWVAPAGAARARVEVCADRPCARVLMQQEVAGTAWRPTARLAPGVAFWRVRALDAAGAVTWTSATWEVGIRHRDLPVDTSYGTLKDFDGDGYDDLAAWCSEQRSLDGVRVYPGGPAGVLPGHYRGLNPPLPTNPDAGPERFGTFGNALAAGDLNGDGLADLVVGNQSLGRVYVHFGSRTCLLSQSDAVYQSSWFDGAGHGEDVSVGDFNGDGYGDMATAGADLRSFLYLGGPSGPSEDETDSTTLGSQCAQFIGDINGDGYADLAVMRNRLTRGDDRESYVRVLYGNPGGRLEYHVQRIDVLPDPATGILIYGLFGHHMRGGDFNEDGYADAVIASDAMVHVYYGSPDGLGRHVILLRPPGATAATYRGAFGGYLGAPGDLDGDGHAEFNVAAGSAPSEFTGTMVIDGAGRNYLYATIGGELSTMWRRVFLPPGGGVHFNTVTSPGDVNGDGYDDLAMAVTEVAIRGTFSWRGDLYVYHGGAGAWWNMWAQAIRGPAGSFLGAALQ